MKRHPNYKGGTITDQRGYVLRYVGKDHHLADCRGYAYEHRIVAERKLGRKLKAGEVIHHDNRKNGDNKASNLIPKKSNGIHISEHLRKRKDLKPLGATNPLIRCGCGCGRKLKKYDQHNRPRKLIFGHRMRGWKRSWDARPWSKKGTIARDAHLARIRHARWGSERTKKDLAKADERKATVHG